jgi:hypothetical protein
VSSIDAESVAALGFCRWSGLLVVSVVVRHGSVGRVLCKFPAREAGMKPSGEEEYQRFMGFPASLWPWSEPGNRRSQGEGNGSGRDLAFWHPIAWFSWRIAVRRQGPYAPDFKDFRGSTQSDNE